MNKKIGIFVLVFFIASPAFASTLPVPVCSISKSVAAPNEKIIFTPKGGGNSVYTFKFIGEASTTATGPTAVSFTYPGVYTVVLQSTSDVEGTYSSLCPAVTVSLDAPAATSTGGLYLFPFTASSTKSKIPREGVDYPATCLNLSQNLSYRYYDDVNIKTDGIIYKLQAFLKEWEYLKADPSGYFGNLTRSAVKIFQDSNDIEPTGFVGPMTRSRIKILSCAS
ncbi:MAG: peptidoglycan-binding domain-containing protein [Patescibacteria group bacterium]